MVMTLLPTSALAAGPQTKLSGSEAAVNPASVITPDAPEEYVTFLFYNGEELVNKQIVKLDGALVHQLLPRFPTAAPSWAGSSARLPSSSALLQGATTAARPSPSRQDLRTCSTSTS